MGSERNDPGRNASIDVLKFFSIVAVIIIHSGPSYYSGPNAIALIKALCGLAVPVFFIIFGYFYGRSLIKGITPKDLYLRYVKRLLIVFVGWSAIYSLPPVSSALFESISQHGWLRTYYWYYTENFEFYPIFLLMGGTAGHLWFLSALIQAITISTVFLHFKKEKALIYFSLLLYLLMPVVNLYGQFGAHEEYAWNPVVGPFKATAYVVCGWWLAKRDNFSLKWVAVMMGAGLLISWGMDKILHESYRIHSTYSNYGLLLEAAAIVLLALIYPGWLKNTPLPRLGQLTLGVYCSHILFVDLFKIFKGQIHPLAWDYIVPVLIYFLALGVMLLLSKIPVLRKLAV